MNLNDYNSLNLQFTEEISRMNNNLNVLVGHYDESSDIFRRLTTLRRDNVIEFQNTFTPLINNNKMLEQKLNSSSIDQFISLNMDSYFADESNLINQVNTSFINGKNRYDDSARVYISILGLLGINL